METFRLWLEADKDIPEFKRLAYEKVNVSLAEVLIKGIHPWQGRNVHETLELRFVQILNSEELKPGEMDQANYCGDISNSSYYPYYYETSPFEETLGRIRESIYFVDDLSYVELLGMARKRLQKMWSHKIAYELLTRSCHGFDAMRTFLRSKDRNIKLSGYADINRYNLGFKLNLSDFDGEDNLIISTGIPVTNFRYSQFLEKITDERGYLRLINSIEHFQVRVNFKSDGQYSYHFLQFNCQRKGEKIFFRPELDSDQSKRARAKEFASRWRTDQGRYCFTTDILRLCRMIEENNYHVTFPSLDYIKPRDGYISSANVALSKVILFSVGAFLSRNTSCETIRNVLRAYGVSMTGRKEDLLEKLAGLAAEVYQNKEHELEAYFSSNQFVRMASCRYRDGNSFPILEGCDLRNLVLTMYIIKHMRGNTILEAKHDNDTYDLLSLARSLIRKEVSLKGSFLRVE